VGCGWGADVATLSVLVGVSHSVYFFFFQAEDGIRDWSVTGVQTCALPICTAGDRGDVLQLVQAAVAEAGRAHRQGLEHLVHVVRSEERRVGKEWRSRWWPYN